MYKYFILYKKALLIEKLIYIFLRTITVNYNLLKEIISDRDKLFILKF